MLNTIGIGPYIQRNPSEFTGRALEGVMVECRTVKKKEDLKYHSLSSQDKAVAFADFPCSL